MSISQRLVLTLADILEGADVTPAELGTLSDDEWGTAMWAAAGRGVPTGPLTPKLRRQVYGVLVDRARCAGDPFTRLPT